MTSRIPFTAYDPRLVAVWRAGAAAPTIVNEVPSSLVDPEHRLRCNKLIKLSQLLHEVRTAAKRDKVPGWETLFDAVQRKDYVGGRLVRLRIEPRSHTVDDLLGDFTPTTDAPAPPAPIAIPDDILADVFGAIDGDAT